MFGGNLSTRQIVVYSALAVVIGVLSYAFGGDFLKTSLFSTSQKSAIASLARAQIGKPYVLGATGPDSFDCSGLAKYVLSKTVGVTLPRRSVDQAGVGRSIAFSDVGVGDLAFFATMGAGRVSHVGIITKVEGGRVWMVNANSVDMQMKEEEIAGYWKRTYMFSREITEFTKDTVADASAHDATVNEAPPAPDVAYRVSNTGQAIAFAPSEVQLGAF